MPCCTVCGREYDELMNVGTWQCGQHRDPFDFVLRVYPCCGRKMRPCPGTDRVGCVPSDHNPGPPRDEDGFPVPYNYRHDVFVTMSNISSAVNIEAIVNDDSFDGYFARVRVRRFRDQ